MGKTSGEFRITIPAGRTLEVNTANLERPTDATEPAEYVLPIGGKTAMEMRITDGRQNSNADGLLFATTSIGVNIQPGEINWSAQTELQVLGDEILSLTCHVPDSLEIISVASSGLESWELADVPNEDTLTQVTLHFRQGVQGYRGISLKGILSAGSNESWDVPTLTFPQADAHTGFIVVQHPETLRVQEIESAGVLAERTSAKQTNAEIRYRMWDQAFRLRFLTTLKEHVVSAAMTNVLDITAADLKLYTTVSIETRVAPLFDFRLRLPSDWEVTAIELDGTSVAWKTVSNVAGTNEIRVPFASPLLPGQVRNLSLAFRSLPDNWPVKETPTRIVIPEVTLPQAAMIEALYGIAADEHFNVVTQEITGLDPADKQEIESLNAKLQPYGKSVRLGLTYQDTIFSGQLDVSREASVLTTETVTFFRIDPETVFTRLEAILDVTGGGYRDLTVQLSESAGEEVRFSLLPDPGQQNTQPVRILEQLPGEVQDAKRNWSLRFDQYLQGHYRLVTEVRTPRGSEAEFTPVRLDFPGLSGRQWLSRD